MSSAVASATWYSSATPTNSSGNSGTISTASLQEPANPGGSVSGGGWGNGSGVWGTYILNSVSCPSTSMCWAVGTNYDSTTASNEGVVAEWNGSGWGSPIVVGGTNGLNSVSCPSTSMCWAVGYNSSNEGVAAEYPTFTITLSWSIPSPSTDYNGYPLYPTIVIYKATTTSSTCPSSGYSSLITEAASTDSYTDNNVSSGASYCYDLYFQDWNWTSPSAIIGPITP